MPMTATPGALGRRATDLTTFTIRVDGEPIPGTYGVVSVDIIQAVNRIPALSIVLQDGDPARQDFEVSAGDRFLPGHRIEVEAGYGGDETRLFGGVITGQRIRALRKGESLLSVEGKGAAFRMTLDRRSRYFRSLSDADLFAEVTEAYPDLEVEVVGGARIHEEIVQHQVSDWDFLVSRAERLGMICLPLDDGLRFTIPNLSDEPVLAAAYGMGVIELDLELDARDQRRGVLADTWDPGSQELLRAETSEAPAPAQGDLPGTELAESVGTGDLHIRHPGPLGPEELDDWATAHLLRSRFCRIRGTVRLRGTEAVRPGDLIELGGLGGRFNGKAFVSGVRHTLGRGEWETAVQVGLDRRWHHELHALTPTPAAGLNPPVHGLQIGVVTQMEEDPQGDDRIRVRLPLVSADDMGTWARLATLNAGPERGSVFRPEVGDEVVVGFLDDDPNGAVVLGALHSGARPAPLPGEDDNRQKGFVSREGLRCLFDEEERSVTLETPGGRRIQLSDGAGRILFEDESGNSIRMDSGGIAVESAADVVVKAAAEVTIEAPKVVLKASALEAEGSASASLRSGGTTEVKGALVRIN